MYTSKSITESIRKLDESFRISNPSPATPSSTKINTPSTPSRVPATVVPPSPLPSFSNQKTETKSTPSQNKDNPNLSSTTSTPIRTRTRSAANTAASKSPNSKISKASDSKDPDSKDSDSKDSKDPSVGLDEEKKRKRDAKNKQADFDYEEGTLLILFDFICHPIFNMFVYIFTIVPHSLLFRFSSEATQQKS